jgi:hypothetical protein
MIKGVSKKVITSAEREKYFLFWKRWFKKELLVKKI